MRVRRHRTTHSYRRLAQMLRVTRVAATWLTLGISACATGPHYKIPDSRAAMPSTFDTRDSTLPATAPVDRWWTVLGDATLDALIAHALSDDPDLATAEARVQQARAQARIAGATFYPAANLDGRVSRDKLSRNGESLALIPFPLGTTLFTDYRVGFDASWEIDLAGKNRRDVEAAVARLESTDESRNDARSVVAAEVADAYVDYRASARRLELAQQTLAAYDETLRLTVLEQHAGLSSETDRRRVEADRFIAAGALPSLAAEGRGALFKLAALTGASAESLTAELAAPRELPSLPATVSIGLPADLLRRRPDVRRAERDLAASTADVGSAVAAQFPRLSLTGDFGWDSVHPGDLTKAASQYWNLTPQLTLPLFAGGKLRAQVRESEAAHDAELGMYRATVMRALADAETTIVRLAGERNRQDSLEAVSAALTTNVTRERQRYAAGDVAMIEVLAAERAANQAMDQQVASQAQLTRDYVALGKALGGGWQSQW